MPDSEVNFREAGAESGPDSEQEPGRQTLQGLYTPAMLASAVGVPLSAVRRWERRGYLRATAVRNRVSYFDFGEATVARRLSELLDASGSLTGVDRLVDRLSRALPGVDRPLMTTPFVIEAGKIFLREGDALVEPGGQRLMEFSATQEGPDEAGAPILSITASDSQEDPRRRAAELYDEGAVDEAIEALRVAMLCDGAGPEDHFTLGEWLYEAEQTEAARERFYATLELDGEHVEARVNLACLLAELGQSELAVAAFRGTLEEHPFYADAHFHLASTLERVGDRDAAAEHFRRFLEIAPESPWAEEARLRLKEYPTA